MDQSKSKKTELRVVILIIASNNFEHEADLLCQKRTWVSTCNKNVTVIYLRGWNNNYFKKQNDTLFVPCKEEYNQILKKTLLGIKYILDHYEFDILIRSNVSTYFETNRLMLELNKPRYKKTFFGGYIDETRNNQFNKPFSSGYVSGAGIFLSKVAAQRLLEINPTNYPNIFDDLVISYFLSCTEIPRIRVGRNNLHSTHFFIPTFCIRAKNSSNPDSASRRMNLIHLYFTKKGFLQKMHSYFNVQINEFKEFRNTPDPLNSLIRKNRVVIFAFLKLKIYRGSW